MKTFPNLAGVLRFYFGLGRVLTLVAAVLWIGGLLFAPSLHRFFPDNPKLMVSLGEGGLRTDPGAVELRADPAKPGSVTLTDLRGSLQADLMSKDETLVSALRWTAIPSVVVLAVFSWWLFGSLRRVCGNIEAREAFSETNLQLVRRVGLILIGYNVTALAVQFWAVHVMNGYLGQHVTLAGIKAAAAFPGGLGAVQYGFSSAHFPTEGGFITGFMVLLLAEAFRQGVALKAENDLTI